MKIDLGIIKFELRTDVTNIGLGVRAIVNKTENKKTVAIVACYFLVFTVLITVIF